MWMLMYSLMWTSPLSSQSVTAYVFESPTACYVAAGLDVQGVEQECIASWKYRRIED